MWGSCWFAVLLLLLFFSGWLLPSKSAVVFALPSNQVVVVDVWVLPLLLIGYCGAVCSRKVLWR
jgi:hypothetical protein